jgi:hypothetical protein
VNDNAYQEKVYKQLKDFGEVAANIRSIPMKSEDFQYDRDSSAPIQFLKKSYAMDESLLTPTKQLFEVGETVTYKGSGLRTTPSTQGTLIPVTSTDTLKIISAPVYDANEDSRNQFVWYPVEMSKNGKVVKGYIASQYVVKR